MLFQETYLWVLDFDSFCDCPLYWSWGLKEHSVVTIQLKFLEPELKALTLMLVSKENNVKAMSCFNDVAGQLELCAYYTWVL